MRFPPIVFLFLAVSVLCARAIEGERLFYLANGEVLQGCVYKPKGDGPFPTVVFNQSATTAMPASGPVNPHPALAQFYVSRNYVFFVPGRYKLSKSSAEENESTDETANDGSQESISNHQQQAEIIFAGIEALKAQSYVKPRRIYVTGFATGATTTLFLAEKDFDVCGYVLFSPAAGVWKRQPALQKVLIDAVKNARAPIFLIQPANDYGLEPMEVLGRELKRKGPPNRSKVFPAHGKNAKQANHFAITAPEVWGADVLSFFDDVLD